MPFCEECAGISYDYENFDEVYVPRIKLQKELLKAIQRKELIWVDGPSGSGKTTLVSWLVRELMKGVDKYRVLPILVRIKPRSVYDAFSAIELLVESGVRDYLKGDDVGRFLDSARRGLDYLSRFLKTASIVLRASLRFIMDPVTLILNSLCFLGALYNKAHKYSQIKIEEEFLKVVADELSEEIGKRFKDFKYTEALLIVDDLGDLPDDTSRKKVLEVLTYLAKEIQLKVLVVRRRIKVKRPIGKKLLGVLRAEEDLLRKYYRVEVPGLSRDELDILKRIVRTLPLKSKRKFRFKEGEEDEIAGELFRRTGGLPRMLCIAMYLYLRKTRRLRDWDLLTLNRVREYVESGVEEILDSYLDYLAKTYGGIYAKEFREVLEVASCMLNFTKEELVEITGHRKGVERFLKWKGIKRVGKAYDFNDKYYWLKHAVYETVLSDEEKVENHRAVLDYLKGRIDELERELEGIVPEIDKPTCQVSLEDLEKGLLYLRSLIMVVYHAEELLKLVSDERKRKELTRLIVEESMDLLEFAYYEGIPSIAIEYSLKIYNYAKELKMWVEALYVAERVLCYAVAAQLREKIAKSIKKELRGIFKKAKKENEEDARCFYARALKSWAFYALNALIDDKEAKSAINEGLSVVGGRDSKLISDELKWYDAYSQLLAIQVDIAMDSGDYDSAMRILKEWRELLDEYKDGIVKRWGEYAYYDDLAVIKDRLGRLTEKIADSEDMLRESLKHFESSLKNNLKTGRIDDVARARVNLARIMMLLAESPDDFKRAISEEIEGYNLNKCIKIFEITGDEDSEAKAKILMSISLLANKKYNRAIKLVGEALGIVEGSPDEYLRAIYELTLAYILMISNLSKFRKNVNIAELIYRLTLSAHNRFEELKVTGSFISSAIIAIELCLSGDESINELLRDLDRLVFMLGKAKDKKLEWVLRRVREVIERKGLNEEVLRTTVIKLLIAL